MFGIGECVVVADTERNHARIVVVASAIPQPPPWSSQTGNREYYVTAEQAVVEKYDTPWRLGTLFTPTLVANRDHRMATELEPSERRQDAKRATMEGDTRIHCQSL